MSSIKPVIRELKQAVLNGMGKTKDNLHHLADNIVRHVDDFALRVRGIDKYEPKHKSPVQRDWRGNWNIDRNAQQDLIDRKANGETLPDPDRMLPERYRSEHLAQFDNGGSRIQSKSGYDAYGPFRSDGDNQTFLMPTDQVQHVLDNANGDISLIESQLGLNPGDLQAPLVHVEFPTLTSADVHMPSGNETGANSSWLPFGHLPTGVSEAVHADSGLPQVVHDIPLK
ncbi:MULTISPECIES: hypothetical protein [unclassified Microbacterium]|uniref:hypothetical protein n=1 Tax=unclassified Microbacterium TaxID=2609290 RepID=UPI001DB628DB|nr:MULTISPECIES: hypothetical protein [unclassified Microbacterium]CAH0123084.1 hypothetical protein SRABI121_00263 [Microbacterium sp. Bi121]HWK79077.1 hypothetical protein [Microbacterium sp.]